MIIGINATAALKHSRTGVEEYTYQLIKHLTMLPESKGHRFLLYVPAARHDANLRIYANDANGCFDFPLPPNFEIKILKWPLPFLWTQVRLAWEMLRRPPEALFIPVHILPFFHPKNSIVTIHGLEYEYFPECYPLLHRLYLRWGTRYALKRARKIIAISENTKRDLVMLYGGNAEKIEVIYHGIFNPPAPLLKEGNIAHTPLVKGGEGGLSQPYLFYLGRIEQKKNIEGILEAYKILKEKYQIPHELVLAGAPGYGYEKIKFLIHNSKFTIHELGYVSEDQKQRLLANADIFLFPSFFEGFGLPVLEAQATRVPVVTSFNSSLPEVAGEGALFVDPKNPAQIAEAVKSIIDDKTLRDRLIESGCENLKRFDWSKCARQTISILEKMN